MFNNAGLVVFILKDKFDEFYTKTYWRHSQKGSSRTKNIWIQFQDIFTLMGKCYKSKTIKVESLRLAVLL